MNDEIKEILDRLNDDGYALENSYYRLFKEDRDKLFDYITNLQEEAEDLRESDWAWHQTLKAQNKREYRSKFLKEFQQEYNTNTFPDYDKIYKRYDKLKEENKRLNNIINDKKERQDIAIRLLQKMFGTDDYEINYIIGIINGQRQIKFDEELKEGK